MGEVHRTGGAMSEKTIPTREQVEARVALLPSYQRAHILDKMAKLTEGERQMFFRAVLEASDGE